MKVTYDDKIIEIDKPQKIIDVLREYCDKDKVACVCNNKIRSLNYVIEEDSKIELVDITCNDGKRVYIRGLMHVMAKAFYELYPNALITTNYQLYNSMYMQIDNMEVTEEMLQNVHKKMQEIIDKDIPFEKVELSKEQAKELYKKENTLRGKLQLDIESKEKISLYYCEEYFNYFYGVMPISTGYIKVYDIVKYKEGFLVRYPSRKDPTKVPEFIDNEKLLAALQDYEDIHRILHVNTLYNLNKSIKEGKAKDVVLLAEALHEKRISIISDEIHKNKEVKMVLIAGPSSSGKTTFAQRLGLQLKLNGLKPVTISVDNYFVEREDTPKDENGKYDFESIDAIDVKLFNDHLVKMLNGEEVKIPSFNFFTGKKEYKGNTIKLEEDSVLVIEGIHCLNDKLTSQVEKNKKYKVYISALTVLNIDYHNRISTTDSRLIRRIVRDNQFRGYSALHTLKMWPSVNKGEDKNIFPFQEEADIMFNTSIIYELCVLKNYIVPLLEEIDENEEEYKEAKRLCDLFQYIEPISKDLVPTNSILREFVGDGDFEH